MPRLKDMVSNTMQDCLDEAYRVPGNVAVDDIDVSQCLAIDTEIIIHELQQIESKNDPELYKFISLSYKTLLDIGFINKAAHRIQIANAFMNVRFVSALCNVLPSLQLTDIEKIACNKLMYDYLTMSSDKNEYIVNLLYNLGWNINRNHAAGLQGKGMDNHTISYLTIARFSTTDLVLATQRVNVVIINQPLRIMTEQVIVNIYEELFNDSLSSLFNGIMFDKWGDAVEMDEEQEEIYGTISLAILDIVNEMPFNMIVQLLHSYAQSKQYLHPNDRARFDIHSISGDYLRVLQAIHHTEMVDKIMVPHM